MGAALPYVGPLLTTVGGRLVDSIFGGGGGGGGADVGAILPAMAAQAAADRESLTKLFTAQLAAMQAQIKALMELLAKPPAAPVKVAEGLIAATGKTKEELLREAHAAFGIDPVNRFNIALPGFSGAGKSSLINAILGEDVAPVGVTECTAVPTPYEVPGSCLTLWDLPGWGTTAHPTATYFMDKRLYAFDAMIVVYANRAPEGFAMIAEGCKEFGLQYAVARNKADLDIASLMRSTRKRNAEGVLETIPGLSYNEAVAALKAKVDAELSKLGGVAVLFSRNFLISGQDLHDGKAHMDEEALLGFVREAAATRSGGPAAATGGAGGAA